MQYFTRTSRVAIAGRIALALLAVKVFMVGSSFMFASHATTGVCTVRLHVIQSFPQDLDRNT